MRYFPVPHGNPDEVHAPPSVRFALMGLIKEANLVITSEMFVDRSVSPMTPAGPLMGPICWKIQQS